MRQHDRSGCVLSSEVLCKETSKVAKQYWLRAQHQGLVRVQSTSRSAEHAAPDLLVVHAEPQLCFPTLDLWPTLTQVAVELKECYSTGCNARELLMLIPEH